MGAAAEGRLHLNQQPGCCATLPAAPEVGTGRDGFVPIRLVVDQALDRAAESAVPD